MSCDMACISFAGIWAAQVFYFLCLIPQMLTNYKNKSGTGLSDFLLLGYFNAYICVLYYVFCCCLPTAYQVLCPLQAGATAVLVFQRLYYEPFSQVKLGWILYGINTIIALAILPIAFSQPHLVGVIGGWGMFLLGLINQLPQVIKIFQEKSVVGFNIFFALFTLVAAIIEFTTAWIVGLPIQTLLSSLRGILIGLTWILQFLIYRN